LNFVEKVIDIIKQIPSGRATTYGTVATLADSPRGARLIGGILRFNSHKFNLPWHRVINKDGFISIKSMDHPKELQKALLESEGIEVGSNFMVDLDKYGWFGEKYLDCCQLEK
jgi:methylated-DNA-protein-cysteine methyltransferase-like protein